jgi:hypothetical protein
MKFGADGIVTGIQKSLEARLLQSVRKAGGIFQSVTVRIRNKKIEAKQKVDDPPQPAMG